ncbi:protein OBERON 4 [Trifolium pratense]|uniref:protein OBERON 4 n=1 Tax=Trifolium pratense TaxID=57577 RepID=UPI001E69509E|nr:protein OBERON 4 [Trifolium pratense]
MKRLRSTEDLHSYGEKNGADKNSNLSVKDSNSNSNLNRSFSSTGQRSFYYKQENVRKNLISSSSSSSRFDRDRDRDRTVEEDRESSRIVRKRSEHDFDGFDRRKGFDRYSRDGGYSGGGDRDRDRNSIHRSESFCGGSRREFPKGFRSERDRSRREGSVSSWRRGLKDFDESSRGGNSRVEERIVRSPKGFSRDVKSPSWSKDSESEQSKKRSSESPRVFREATKSISKSPSWSKDSESEQSKSVSVEVKKSDELLQQVQSGSGSEMEEGELVPEPAAKTEAEAVCNDAAAGRERLQASEDEQVHKKNEFGSSDADVVMEEKQMLGEKEVKPMEDVDSEVKVKDAEKEVRELSKNQDKSTKEIGVNKDEIRTVDNDNVKKDVCLNGDDTRHKEVEKEKAENNEKALLKKERGENNEKVLLNEEEHEVDKGVGGDKLDGNDEGSTENTVGVEVQEETMMECVTNNVKDKGKSISVAPDVAHASEDGLWIDRGSKDLTTSPADVMEGPSTRGFELFSRSPVRKVEKSDRSVLKKENDDSLGMGQLVLTLSLPNVLLPIGAQETASQAPGSPSQALSVQSLSNTFCTNSDGFTASMSFSGSQSLYHNPSCSLTRNSVDYEQSVGKSVGSRPLFQGFDWQALSQAEPKQKEVPSGQRTSSNGNGSLYQPQASWGILDTQALKGQPSRPLEGSSKMGNGLERQLSFHKQLSGQSRQHDDVRSPTQSVGSHDNGSNYSFEKREVRERSSSSLHRSTSQKGQDNFLMGGLEFVKTIIARIVSEPVQAMSRKFHEMNGQYITRMKEGIRELMVSADNQGQILTFQNVLQNRSDISYDVLVKCHLAQLEILVALKTGVVHYLHLDDNISSSDLAQIFLNLKCRNLSCRNQLHVDECDCKLCVQKNGFCRECMCVVCSKFDNASSTCSWVGCDVCLHWCHTDCGLRESYIRNGLSTTGTKGTTEMQFHCIACDHPSEMFGFVKEVFQNFAKDWSPESLCKELEYVKRIFSASKDIRGRQLHEIADKMLPSLAIKSNIPEVLRHIMSFFSDCDSSKLPMTTIFSGKEQVKENNGVAGPSQEAAWLKSIYSEKPALLERPASILPRFDQNDKRTLVQELQMSSIQKDFCFDELESIIKIKHAEAKMFQSRADDARREAEGLKRIALAKNEKIEEEYANRIAKLRFAETDDLRKQKFEELQAIERAHHEYLNMKMRMESDIKDLLSKMEATKMNLAM